MDSLGEFLRAPDQPDKVSQIPLHKPKLEIGHTKAKELFSHCYKHIVEHLNRQFDYRAVLKRTRLASFPSNSLNNTLINSFLQKLSTWVAAKSIISTGIDFLLLTSVKFLRAIRTYDSNIPAHVLYQNESIVELIADVICRKKKCGEENCVYLTSFEEINRSTYEFKQCKACSHVLNIPFNDQKPCVALFGVPF